MCLVLVEVLLSFEWAFHCEASMWTCFCFNEHAQALNLPITLLRVSDTQVHATRGPPRHYADEVQVALAQPFAILPNSTMAASNLHSTGSLNGFLNGSRNGATPQVFPAIQKLESEFIANEAKKCSKTFFLFIFQVPLGAVGNRVKCNKIVYLYQSDMIYIYIAI